MLETTREEGQACTHGVTHRAARPWADPLGLICGRLSMQEAEAESSQEWGWKCSWEAQPGKRKQQAALGSGGCCVRSKVPGGTFWEHITRCLGSQCSDASSGS